MRKNLLIIVIILLSTKLNAQDIPDTATVELEEVVVSVNKIMEQKKNVAQQVEVITSKQAELFQDQSPAELVANSPAVFVQKSQMGGGSPVIRGFEANRVLLVVDGVRMNNLIYRGGHLQNVITLDESIIDRTEILFGPSSTIYGSDALGGVLHFYTRNPLFSDDSTLNFRVRASSRVGSVNNEFTSHVDFNLGTENFASLTSISRSSFGDLRGGDNQNPFYTKAYGERPFYVDRFNGVDSLVKNNDRFLQVQSGYTQYDILQKFSFRQRKNLTHGLNFQFSTSTDIPRYDRLTDPSSSGGLRFAEWYYGPQQRFLAAYDLVSMPDEGFFDRIHLNVSHQNIIESRHTRQFRNPNLQNRVERVNVSAVNFDVQRIAGAHEFRAGVDGQYNSLRSTASIDNVENGSSGRWNTRYPDGDNSMINAGAYFSHGWNITDKLRLTDAVRLGFSSLNSTFVDTTFFPFPYRDAGQDALLYSGSAGLIYHTSDDLKLSALVSTGFRVPNVDDLAKVFESSAGYLIVPNPDLKPEKTISYELGVSSYRESKGFELSVYYTDFIDAIITDNFRLNGSDSVLFDGQMSRVVANQNKGRAYIYGFSGKVLFNRDRKINGELGMSYTYGRIKTDTTDYPLDHIPPFNARLQFSFTERNFTSAFIVHFNGWKRLKDYNLNGEDNPQYATPEGMPAWFTLNLKNSYRLNEYFTLSGGIENILDTQYRTFASGINGPGRNFYLAVGFNY